MKLKLFILFSIFALVYIFTYSEGFGYDNAPSQFREPKVYPNFITKEDANYILDIAEHNYSESTIVKGNINEIRKSQTYWLSKDDPVAAKIIKNVCKIDGHNIEQAEDIQVVKYEPNGFYREHHDSCCDNDDRCKEFIKDGNRLVTMLIYLNDDFQGGETRFPNLDKGFKPKKYSGLLFYPMNKDGDKCHENSLHAGMPITKGEKYIANIWIREKL